MATNIGKKNYDHCRIGSLENLGDCGPSDRIDHCRIGSLEMKTISMCIKSEDHCRIGSLEMLNGAGYAFVN